MARPALTEKKVPRPLLPTAKMRSPSGDTSKQEMLELAQETVEVELRWRLTVVMLLPTMEKSLGAVPLVEVEDS